MRRQFNGIWVTELHSDDGATVLVADHGAHLLSWTPAVGAPALYLSERSQYSPASAIRGGVPIIFPQFGERGTGKRHGFARVSQWQPVFAGVEHGHGVLRYRLTHQGSTNEHWPHDAELDYEIMFVGQELKLSLRVHNPSTEKWGFCAALHTYLHVSGSERVGISGLQSNDYLDQVQGGVLARQVASVLRINGEVDRIYIAAQEPLILHDGARSVVVRKQGFSDVVVWNPGAEKAAALTDMPAQDYRSFVCLEAGAIMEPVSLDGGGTWSGSQTITIGMQ